MSHVGTISSRPRLTSDLTFYTQRVNLSSRLDLERLEVPNPNIPLDIVNLPFRDERLWDLMATDPVIAASQDSRRTMVLGGGWRLNPGEGEGSEELFQVWSAVLHQHKTHTLIWLTLSTRFPGWQPFEIVGGLRKIDGRTLFVPVKIKSALAHEFRFTATSNLIWRPPGLPAQGFNMGSLQAQMKWFLPTPGALPGRPYGRPVLGHLIPHHDSSTFIRDQGRVQLVRAAGFLKAERRGGDPLKVAAAGLNDKEAAATEAIAGDLRDVLSTFHATGVLIPPPGWNITWESLVPAIEAWLSVFRYHDDLTREHLLGGTSSGRSSSSSGGARASMEVDERTKLRLAKIDAAQACEEISSRLFRPWSAWWGDQVHPAFRRTTDRPRLEDVPATALPRLSFPSLMVPDLDVLAALREAGVEGEMKIDAEDLARAGSLNLVPEGEEGPFVDLQKQAPPSPLGPEMPEDRPEPPDDEADEDEDQDVSD